MQNKQDGGKDRKGVFYEKEKCRFSELVRAVWFDFS
jgi:hypothetical protein